MECLSSRREPEAPGGRARENRKFIQAPSPEIWSETISGGEEVLAGKWGGLFLDFLLGRNYRRRDRDHLIPPRRMDSAVCRAEVCFGIFGSHGLSYPCPLCLPKRKGGWTAFAQLLETWLGSLARICRIAVFGVGSTDADANYDYGHTGGRVEEPWHGLLHSLGSTLPPAAP